MDDERTRTAGLPSGTGTAELDHEHATPGAEANRDPLTGETGSHPVGTGVGAASGGTVGAVIGGAVGGPVGALIGAAVGGLAGGLAGKGVAESVNPTEEDAFWRDNYANRDYAQGRTYDDLQPAYRYGWESRTKHHDRNWDQAENDLRSGWDQARGSSSLAWDDARQATRDAWDRVSGRTHSISSEDRTGETSGSLGYTNSAAGTLNTPGSTLNSTMTGTAPGAVPRFPSGDLGAGAAGLAGSTYGSTPSSTGATSVLAGSNLGSAPAGFEVEDNYWRQSFSSRPYAAGRSYEDYRPAYQYGYDAAHKYRGRRFEDVEGELSDGWSRASSGAGPSWHNVKEAVRDAWHRVERAMPGDADRDGR